MRTSYARLFADENGVSHFQDVDIELIPGFAAPPAEPLHFAPLMNVEKCTLVGATPEWRGDALHPVPRRTLTIVLKGSFEITREMGQFASSTAVTSLSVRIRGDWALHPRHQRGVQSICRYFGRSGVGDCRLQAALNGRQV